MDEATLTDTETGKVVDGDGWFIVNFAEASWEALPDNGTWLNLGSPEAPFAQFGIGPHVLMPGEANGMYHGESDQEGFLVLAGECIAVVEGTERHMRQWDYLHCPPWTEHITIGAGDGPCVILMIGSRSPDQKTQYAVDPVAARHGASVTTATDSAAEAYADRRGPVTRVRAPWPPAEHPSGTAA
jgi:uncharacterized cupin superfamily protein